MNRDFKSYITDEDFYENVINKKYLENGGIENIPIKI